MTAPHPTARASSDLDARLTDDPIALPDVRQSHSGVLRRSLRTYGHHHRAWPAFPCPAPSAGRYNRHTSASLLTWDVLFLLPVPWVGPVLAPVIVAISMIAAGLTGLRREYQHPPVHLNGPVWVAVLPGWILVFVAFSADFLNTITRRLSEGISLGRLSCWRSHLAPRAPHFTSPLRRSKERPICDHECRLPF